jgi:hypothetical protein
MLVNSDHIVRILDNVKQFPEIWSKETTVVLADQKWIDSWNKAYDLSYSADWRTAWDNAQDEAIDSNNGYLTTYSAQGAILALMTWPESAKYLTMPTDQALVWGILNDDPAVVLLIPAIRILSINRLK